VGSRGPHDFGFAGGMAALGTASNVYARIDKRFVRLTDSEPGLSLSLGSGDKVSAETGVLAATVDVSRFSRLLARVGRQEDVQDWAQEWPLSVLADPHRAVAPTAIVAGIARARLVVRHEPGGVFFAAHISR
jgi:hypothetical protein